MTSVIDHPDWRNGDLIWPAIDPADVVDVALNFSLVLSGDTISSATWSVPVGITKGTESNTLNVATVWLSAGVVGIYKLTARITTAGGRTFERSGWIPSQGTMMQTFVAARAKIYSALSPSERIEQVDFVQAEDGGVMIYAYALTVEPIARFDMAPGEQFDADRFRSDFFRPLEIVV